MGGGDPSDDTVSKDGGGVFQAVLNVNTPSMSKLNKDLFNYGADYYLYFKGYINTFYVAEIRPPFQIQNRWYYSQLSSIFPDWLTLRIYLILLDKFYVLKPKRVIFKPQSAKLLS